MNKKVRFAQFLLGIVFLFSGFVKAVDPLGTKYKLIDYFNVLHIDFLNNLAGISALLLIGIELLVGIMFIFNVLPKIGLWLASLMMIIFTPLTLFLAIKNPILDCGCFGDAIHLTNWQTFWKNIIFDLILIYLWINYKKLISTLPKQWLILGLSVVIVFLFQLLNILFLPIIDFRPYKLGVNLKEELNKSQNNVEYKSVLIYKNTKTGEIKAFEENNIPWDDTTWIWQETKTEVIKKEDDNGIHDFYLYNYEGIDITDSLLNISGPLLLIISYNLTEANKKGLEKTFAFAQEFTKKFFPVAYIITGSTEKEIKQMENSLPCYCLEVLNADETMLKTMIRSNPGIIILKNGKIIGKHSFRYNLNKILNKIE